MGITAIGAAAAAQEPVFAVPQSPAHTGAGPLATADFNHDGVPDVVVGSATNFSSPTFVSVHLGGGTGFFTTSADLATANTSITAVATGDLDGDGNDDVFATRYAVFFPSVRVLSYWLGNGAGGFGTRVDVNVSSVPYALAVADLDNDGRLDVITGHSGTGSTNQVVGTFQGNNTGGLNAPIYYNAQPISIQVAAGDLDGDGIKEVLSLGAVTFGSTIFNFLDLFKGTGGFTLQLLNTYSNIGQANKSLYLVDIDGDFDLDATLTTAGELRILRNDGFANFTVELHIHQADGVGQGAADFDFDGILDLAVSHSGLNRVGIFKGPIAPTFGNSISFPVGFTPGQLAVVDANLDGVWDVVVTANVSVVATLVGVPGIYFRNDPLLNAAQNSRRVAFGDLDIDGNVDAVVAYSGEPIMLQIPGGISIFRGQPGGTFLPKVDVPIVGNGLGAVALGDCNGDGKLDAVASTTSAAQVIFFVGNGAGALAIATTIPIGAGGEDVALADLNGDGKLDIATTSGVAGNLLILAGDGLGGFAAPVAIPAGAGAGSIATGDMDNDGRRDLVCTNASANSLSVILASPGGGFLPKVDYATPTGPAHVTQGDVNYDARLDVAVACPSASSVSHRINVGGGVLAAPATYAMATSCASVHYLDWDGDGIHDLASVTSTATQISVRPGDGVGGFGARTDYLGSVSQNSGPGLGSGGQSETADFDGDGRVDLALVSNFALTLLSNRTVPAVGTTPYGAGTPGCGGTLGVSASVPAKVGNGTRLMATNAPDRTFGLAVVSTAQDVAGLDFFGIGILCHVGFNVSNLLAFDAPTDPAGTSFVDLFVPNNPALAGMPVYFQAFFLTTLCKPSPFGLMSSRGLTLTIQP